MGSDSCFVILFERKVRADEGIHDGAELAADVLDRNRAGKGDASRSHVHYFERRLLRLFHFQHTVALDDCRRPVCNEAQADEQYDDCQNLYN